MPEPGGIHSPPRFHFQCDADVAVYQPVMLRTLIDKGGKASVSQLANALLAEDRAQLDYYRETKRMPGTVLRKRGIVAMSGAY